MRFIILGLDALEFDLVRKFSMKNLMQKEYGKIYLDGFKVIVTPPIWASFITGVMPDKHGVLSIWHHTGKWERLLQKMGFSEMGTKKVMDGFFAIIKYLVYRTNGNENIFKFLRFLFGYEKTDHALAERGVKTIFDHVNKSIAINIPSYNWNFDYVVTNFLRKAINDPEGFGTKLEEYVYNIFQKERKNFLKALQRENWDLIMVYIRLADDLGHLYGGNPKKLIKLYTVLDNFAMEVKNSMDSEDILLIVSDHGMKSFGRYGDHSDHGFYSCNWKLYLENPKITDFFQIILEMLKK